MFIARLILLVFCMALPMAYTYANILPDKLISVENQNYISSGITEEDFNQLSDATILPWVEIARKRGKELIANKDWKSWFVASYANQIGDRWIIDLKGGLARHPAMTNDGFVLIVCHELGHHFGGFPSPLPGSGIPRKATPITSRHMFAPKKFGHKISQKMHNIEKPQILRQKRTAIRHGTISVIKTYVTGRKPRQWMWLHFFSEVGNREHPQLSTPDLEIVDQTIQITLRSNVDWIPMSLVASARQNLIWTSSLGSIIPKDKTASRQN